MVIDCLNELGIKQYKMISITSYSHEIFFIGNKIDLTREKKVTHTTVTVYQEHYDNGVRCLGSASGEIHPTMKHDEISKIIKELAFAASLVHNPYYELVDQNANKNAKIQVKEIKAVIQEIISTLNQIEEYEDLFINSSEIFVNYHIVTIINSSGVNYKYLSSDNEMEIVINATDDKQEVEIYKDFRFGSFDRVYLEDLIYQSFNEARQRIKAVKTPNISNVDVIISGKGVVRYFEYYLEIANAKNIYQRVNNIKIDDTVFGSNADHVSIKAVKELKYSSKNVPIDQDGQVVSSFTIYDHAKLVSYWGDHQYLQYINHQENRNAFNFMIEGGTLERDELINPYMEVVSFSSFHVDVTTGHFAGEIRLGYYFDGIERKAITGGSISGNINDNTETFRCAKEVSQFNNYVVPSFIVLKNVKIAAS